MIGQLARAHEQAVTLVERLEVDHRLAAVAALAVHVLEQVQRQRARAVEQQHVALLQVVEIAAWRAPPGCGRGGRGCAAAGAPLGIERGAHLRDRRLQLGRRIGQQRGQHLEGLRIMDDLHRGAWPFRLRRAEQARLGAAVRAAVAEARSRSGRACRRRSRRTRGARSGSRSGPRSWRSP